MRNQHWTAILIAAVFALAMASGAGASTINQNTSWTITKSGATQTYRVVGYGDSIYAGYRGSIFSVAKRAAPYVDGEYAGAVWNQNVQIVRRAKSGAIASDIYNNKIVNERSYMQATNTRIVTFEMCGNDYLQARSQFNGQSGTCNYTGGNNALANCTNYTGLAMNAINQYATTATREDRVESVLPRLRERQREQQLRGLGDRAAGQQAEQQPDAAGQEQLAHLQPRRAAGLLLRRQLRAVHGRGLRLERGQPDRLRRAPLRVRRIGGGVRPEDHRHAALDDPRRQHALRESEHELRLHPLGQHPPHVLRPHPELGRLGLGPRGRRGDRGREESAVEPASVTSGWAGRSRCSTRRRRSGGGQSRKRASTSAGTPA